MRLKSQGSDRRCTQKGLAAHGCACHLQSDALPLHASRLPVALRRLSYPLSPTDPVLIEETTRRHGSGTSPHLSVRACILKLRLLHRVAAICTRDVTSLLPSRASHPEHLIFLSSTRHRFVEETSQRDRPVV